MDRNWTQLKLTKQLERFLKPSIYCRTLSVPAFRFHQSPAGSWPPGSSEGCHLPEFDDSAWGGYTLGDFWGGPDVTAWFRAEVEVPADWSMENLGLVIWTGFQDGCYDSSESLIYVDGAPVQGVDIFHTECLLDSFVKAKIERNGRLFQLALKSFSGHWGCPNQRRMNKCELVIVDTNAKYIVAAFSNVLQALELMPETSLSRVTLLKVLNNAYNMLDMINYKKPAYYASAAAAAAYLEEALAPILSSNELRPEMHCIGHSHIDVAWKWRKDATVDKTARTFSTVLNLMGRYEDYKFMHSSPWCYEMMEKYYPELYEKIQEKAKEGRWQINGSMYVESDTLIPSGEALIRQIMEGKRYAREKFGVENRVLWLPDVFGFSYALPQIMKKSGLDVLVTAKLGWSQYNKFPYDTFMWKGIDGTAVLAAFLTTPEFDVSSDNIHRPMTYNSPMRPKDIFAAWEDYRQKDINDKLVATFGQGDGGGGPMENMLDTIRFFGNFPHFPKTRFADLEPFYKALVESLENADTPVWDDELYFELHRGTYTSQAKIKRANKMSEVLYHNAELACATAWARNGFTYPQEALRAGWKYILFNQFHDVLPGSSIPEVYDEAMIDYGHAAKIGETALTDGLTAISGKGDGRLFFNGLSWARDAQILMPDGSLAFVGTVPPMGALAVSDSALASASPKTTATVSVSARRMESPYYAIELNEIGQITRLFDKAAGREVLQAGEVANAFTVFEDRPMRFNAWDIDCFYAQKPYPVETLIAIEVVHTDVNQGTLKLKHQIFESTIEQEITLYADKPGIYFKTNIDWHQQQALLKVAFPIAVHAKTARYGMQFGSMERPTHWNTPYDFAKFEVFGHGWADLSETGYGVALAADCKYGFDIHEQTMRLTCLKSAIDPDPMADQGQHLFTYAVIPHQGTWQEAMVPRYAYELSNPVLDTSAGSNADAISLVAAADDGIIIETVKRSEDGTALVIRAYEWQNRRATGVRLSFGIRVASVVECDMMENEITPVAHDTEGFITEFAPFEVKSFLVRTHR